MTGAEKALERERRKIKRKEQMVEGLNFKRGWGMGSRTCREIKINFRKRMNDKMVKIQVCF